MISYKDIVKIKIAQQNAGLNDLAYRELLQDEAGVYSCKALEPYQVPDVLKAIKACGDRRDGWKFRQLAKYRQYGNYCGMTPKVRQVFLLDTVSVTDEESPFLTQAMFDRVMAEIEAELENRIMQEVVKQPAKLNLNYWRDRRPATGKSNSRETFKIVQEWKKLAPFLPKEKQSEAYLNGIATKACNRDVSDLRTLSAYEAFKVIEAIKGRRVREEEKVPF